MKSVTIPIGGTGLVAIAISVFAWVPTKVESVVGEMVSTYNIEQRVREVADETLEKEVDEQVSAAVVAYLDSDPGKKMLQHGVALAVADVLPEVVAKALPEAVSEGFGDEEVKELISQKATEYVQGADGQKFIADVVRTTLEPALRTAASDVESRAQELVSTVVGDAVEAEKGGERQLEELLNSPRMAEAKRSGAPVVLTKTVGIGAYYVPEAIDMWIERFTEEFADQFSHVALFYGDQRADGEFLALIDKQAFQHQLHQGPQLIEILRKRTDELNYEEARNAVKSLFGSGSTRKILQTRSIGRVLKDGEVWVGSPEMVPVVTETRQFVGVTSRQALVQSLLKTL